MTTKTPTRGKTSAKTQKVPDATTQTDVQTEATETQENVAADQDRLTALEANQAAMHENIKSISNAMEVFVKQFGKSIELGNDPVDRGTVEFNPQNQQVGGQIIMPGAPEFTNDADWQHKMNFLEELVHIYISPTAYEHETPFVDCGVNGEMLYLWKGARHKIKRKFLANLLQTYSLRYGSRAMRNGYGHISKYEYPAHSRKVCQISIIEDSDEGRSWAEAMDAHYQQAWQQRPITGY